MRTRCTTIVLAMALTWMPAVAAGEPNASCVSLAATANNATTSRQGALITAPADASGFCSFTVSVCVNDAAAAGCSPAPVKYFKILPPGDPTLQTVQQTMRAHLPTDQRVCAQTTLKVGQTRHRRVLASAAGSDGHPDSKSVTLACQCAAGTPFSSTFQGIQEMIFARHGCTQALCHGSQSKQGGLDLSPGAAYQNLIEVPSTESHLNRVQPGDQNRSYLWLKLAAKTDPSLLPSGAEVAGAPMPNGLAALSGTELEALRLWIFSGAPQSGTVGGTESLLSACMPPPEPITIKPLDPPAPGTGVQFVMPPWNLEAHSEHELCFATYYDITSQVPQEFQDPSGTMFRFSGNELRQDPQSHHLILNRYAGSAADIHDPSFGTWTCNGGDHPGQTCEPTDPSACGSGICTSTIRQSFACLGFGPFGNGGPTFYAIGGAQKAQSDTEFIDGVFAQIPMKGILYWNSHAFNLTDENTVMHARLNYYFAQNPIFPVQGIFDISKIFAPNAAPFTTQTVCNNDVLPQGARLFSLSSHTHKHGKHFTVTAPDGSLLYESFIYNDPATQAFDPPLLFDSPDPAQRTLRYCSLYNNGVAADGSPDPSTVTRYSQLPDSAKRSIGNCRPLACVSGQIGKACGGVGDDRTCDSAPGANDGSCDACRITGGESTENEMFILIGDYYIDTSGAAGLSPALAGEGLDASGHSTTTEVVLPPQVGCSTSHQAHHMHAGHTPH